MTTTAPQSLLWLAREWTDRVPSAVLSGIVGDPAHQRTASKHNSRQDNPPGSWPMRAAKDKQGPSNTAAAIDVSQSRADMIRVHNNFKALYRNRATDSRAQYIAAFNGWDGEGAPGRYDLVNGTVTVTDSSHEWHEHVELYYLYASGMADAMKAARAALSVVVGESDDQFRARESGEEDVGDFTAAEMKAFPWQYAGGGLPAGVGSALTVFTAIYNNSKATLDLLTLVASEVNIDEVELEQIKQAAQEGATASAQGIIDGVLAGLPEGMLSKDDVAQALRDVLIEGVEQDEPA